MQNFRWYINDSPLRITSILSDNLKTCVHIGSESVGPEFVSAEVSPHDITEELKNIKVLEFEPLKALAWKP